MEALALRSSIELQALNDRLELASAEMQGLIDGLGEGVLVLDAELEHVRMNRMAEEVLELRAKHGNVIYDADGALFPKERWPAVTARRTGKPQLNVIMGFGENEDRRWLAVSATPMSVVRGREKLERIVVSVRDVTELISRETEQRNYARRLHALHLIASTTTQARDAQIEAALLVGLEPLGRGHAFFVKLDHATKELVCACCVAAAGDSADDAPIGRRFALERTFIGRAIGSDEVLTMLDLAAESEARGHSDYADSGSYIAVRVAIDDVPYGAIGFRGRMPRTKPFTAEIIEFVKLTAKLIASSIERDLQNERLDALAFFDALTGLPNRVLLDDRLAQAILASERRNERFAVLFLDLDGFKAVNDRFGHAAGDTVLRAVAARMQDVVRESDTVARFGGDEFVTVATGVPTVRDARRFAERILRSVRAPIDDGERTHVLTASIGVSFYPDDGIDTKSLIERADTALYYAKHGGKDRVRFARDNGDERGQDDFGTAVAPARTGRCPRPS